MKTTQVGANRIEKVETSQRVGDTTIHKEAVTSTEELDSKELTISKVTQVIWFIINVIGVVILLRFIFLMLGANLTGFTLIIYNISNPFVSIFQGIFPAPQTNGSYFESASILAIIVWYLLGYLATYAIALFSKSGETVE